MVNNFNIEKFLDLSTYVTDERKERRKNRHNTSIKDTHEFFTPYSIVKRMCDKIPDEDWANPEKTWLESGFGNGQFVVYIVWNRIQHGVDWQTALKTLYGVELMSDNVIECHDRVIDLLTKLDIEFDERTARKIMKKNLVCSDFFKWDFEHWRPIQEKPKKSKNPETKQLSLFEE